MKTHASLPSASALPARPSRAQAGRDAVDAGGGSHAQTPARTPAARPAAAPASPSLSLSNDSYADTGNVSHKHIKFNVAVPTGLNAADFCLVNKVQGHLKNADGTFRNAVMYGSVVPYNFPTEQVDSIDADPIYWSTPSQRRNYTTEAGGFSATDDPGPSSLGYAFAPGMEARLKFHIGLYRTAEVPTTTTGTLAASPISELPWQYSVVANATTGAITHPVL
ncbi:hypothetical protein DBR47_22225 [Paucibacter sp. KBW04]|uniref:hypothetical protein n=1 Tax=Paucibacter sp. KBW04 TaxID=2153361 RepID=UPI000F568851|nr:hypothetical protein [Paucibacter sp. KBW04]RQO54786.1 hypothetical protein DBR47_22225 [Paucibacter sp. KBW04]